MDEWIATNAGNSVAGGDGAFERFITAAVAAIITIMFSWRLLAEQADGTESQQGAAGLNIDDIQLRVREEIVKDFAGYKQLEAPKASSKVDNVDHQDSEDSMGEMGVPTGGEDHIDREESMYGILEQEPKIQDLSLDEYRISQTIPKESLSLKKWPSFENNDFDSGFESNRWTGLPGENDMRQRSFSDGEGQTNPAYNDDFMEDEFNPFNPFDPFSNSDPFDDNAEPRVLDSDEEMYCCNMLETIMEEDSDEIPSSESDNDSLKRYKVNPRKFKPEESSGESDNESLKRFKSQNVKYDDSDSDNDSYNQSKAKKFKQEDYRSSESDSEKQFDIEPQNGVLKRYVTRKLESDELLEAVVPEQKTNVLDDSCENDDDSDDESGISTSHVTLFTRETVSIRDSEGNIERTNIVHKVNIPVDDDDLTIQQLMSRASTYPIAPEENNSSGSDESIVTVLTRQNSSLSIDSNGSPKMIENVTNNTVSSAFPALTPGSHGDENRSTDDNTSTRPIEAGKYSSIKTQPAYYNNSTCPVTSTQFVHIPSNSTWNTGRSSPATRESSADECADLKYIEDNVTISETASGNLDVNNKVGIVYPPNNSDLLKHDLQQGVDTLFKSRAAELIDKHKSALERALQKQSDTLDKIRVTDNLVISDSSFDNSQEVNEQSIVTDNTSTSNNFKTISADSVNNTERNLDNLGYTTDSVQQSNVINLANNQSELATINSVTNQTTNETLKDIRPSETDICDRVEYVDAYHSSGVKNSPQSFIFTKKTGQLIDYQQTNYTLDRDPEDLQYVDDNVDIDDNVDVDLKPIPIPRKRLSVDLKTKVDSSSDSDQPTAKVQKSNQSTNGQLQPLKIIVPNVTDFDFEEDNDSDTHPDVSALKRQELTLSKSYNRKSDIEDSDEIADKSFDDDDSANLACVEEVIGSYHSDSSPRLQFHSDSEDLKESPKRRPKPKLETNIDDVFVDNNQLEQENELIEIYNEETGLWSLRSKDGTVQEYLNDVSREGESERSIFFKRCVRQSVDDLEPGNFLDFTRGVEESPPDGGSPVRTSSPVIVLEEDAKPRFELQSVINKVEPVLEAASEKLTRQASLVTSPVVQFTESPPKLLKAKQSKLSRAPKTSRAASYSRQVPIRRQSSKETTFGPPEPNASSKETTFGPPEPNASSKETTFGPPEPNTSSKETTFGPPKPNTSSKETTFGPPEPNASSKETTFGPPEPNASSKETTFSPPEPNSSSKETTFGPPEPHKASSKETTFGPPESNASSKETTFDSKPVNSDKETTFGTKPPVLSKISSKETNIDLEINTFNKSTSKVTESKTITTSKKEKRITFKENVKPTTLEIEPQQTHTTIERDNPFRINTPEKQRNIQADVQVPTETLIDDSPRVHTETNIDDVLQNDNPFRDETLKINRTYEKIETVIERTRETVIDAPGPIIESKSVSKTPSRETVIGAPGPTIESKSVIKAPSRETVIGYSTTERTTETLIDAPGPTMESKSVSKTPSRETMINAPGPTIESKSVRKAPSRETLIDDPSPVVQLPATQAKKPKETYIDNPIVVQSSPVLKSPTITSPVIQQPTFFPSNTSVQENHETRTKTVQIETQYKTTTKTTPNAKSSQSKATLIDAPTIVYQSPKTPKETNIDDDAPVPVFEETCIDDVTDNIPHNDLKETLIDGPAVTLESSPIVKTLPIKKPTKIPYDETAPIINPGPTITSPIVLQSPTLRAPESSTYWPTVQLPPKVTDHTSLQNNNESITRPAPIETSIDDPVIPIPPKITHASIYESVIVVPNSPSVRPTTLETTIDEPLVPSSQNITETLIDNSILKTVPKFETNIDDVFDLPTTENIEDNLPESPQSSLTSTNYSTSSQEHSLSIDTRERIQARPQRGFEEPASPTSHQSDIDDHNVTNPTSSEDFNNSEYDSNNESSLDGSVGEVHRRPRSLRQIKRKIAQHRAYKNALEAGVPLTAGQLSAHTNREDIIASRKRFLSEGNLSKTEKSERQKQLFEDYKKHLLSPLPKIGKFTPNKRYRSKSAFSSIEKINHITELYASRIDSDESFRKPHSHELHENCILSAEGRREIHNQTQSIENLNEHLRRFGSATSLVETDLDTWETSEQPVYPDTDLDFSLYLQQQPSDRAVSMTDLRSERSHRKPASRRFADRHLAPKSKSLQTLETNIDDDDDVFPGDTISRTPSVHELRVTKSLQKLNVPDWYKHSNLTKSASTILRRDSTSTMSSFGYSAFSPSLMSSPSPSVISQSGNVVIKTRVTPTSSSRIFRKYTPATTVAQDAYRRSVLDSKSRSTPNVRLPSEKYREKEKPKGLMPVPILPFRQIRAMFEAKAANAKAEKKKQEEKPNSPEMGKKETVSIPTVTFSDDENGSEIPVNGETVSQRPSSPPSPQSPTQEPMPESASVNTSFERRLPKPILKLTEHFRSSKSKTSSTPPRVKSPETVLPASNVHVEATVTIPESTVIKRPPVTEPTEKVNKKPELKPKPRSTNSTTRTPESQPPPPPPPSDNKQRSSYKVSTAISKDISKRPLPDLPSPDNHQPFARNVVEFEDPKPYKSPNGVIYHDIVVSPTKVEPSSASLEDVLNCMLGMNDERKPPTIKRRHTTGRNDRKSHDYRRFLSDDALETRSRDICTTTWSADYYDVSDEYLRNPESEELADVIVHCENPKCVNKCSMPEAKRSYTTCHNCYTYYCGQECRKTNWTNHKNDCYVTRVNTMCKNIVKSVNKDSHILYYVSRFARRGYLHRGRGCAVLNFINIDAAQKLLQEGLSHNNVSPMYMTIAEIDRALMFGEIRIGLTALCSNYNPDYKFVLYVGIGVGSQITSANFAPPRTQDAVIEKGAVLRMSPAHMLPDLDEFDDLSVLVLTAVKGTVNDDVAAKRKCREVGLINIQRKLQERGVTLRYQYPEIYYKLINFVSDSELFAPEILFPIDSRTGRRFTCIIMIASEQDIVWMPDNKTEF